MMDLGDGMSEVEFLNRDVKFTTAFDSVFASEGIRVLVAPLRAPRARLMRTSPARVTMVTGLDRRGFIASLDPGRKRRPGAPFPALVELAAGSRPRPAGPDVVQELLERPCHAIGVLDRRRVADAGQFD